METIQENKTKPTIIKKCPHNKRKSVCVECGGVSICEHGKIKYRCKDCGGSSICEHGKTREICKDCGGNQICVHNKYKRYCKECDGRAYCSHDKRKSICRECGGGAYCQHGIDKRRCIECGGVLMCTHGKRKIYCAICDGKSLCEHKRQRNKCKDCGGGSYCIHQKQKQDCRECGGNAFCQHNKRKINCKPCGGKNVCKSDWCENIPHNKKYEGYCLLCFVNLFPDKPNVRNYKTKEKAVADDIIKSFPQFTWIADKRVQDGCSKRRPDLLLDIGSHIIIVEVDENKHTDYDCSCEHKRLMELSQDLQHRPIVFIRFNPDDYVDQAGATVRSCWRVNKLGVMQIMKTKESEWANRIDCLKQQIQYWILNPTEKTVEIVELFY